MRMIDSHFHASFACHSSTNAFRFIPFLNLLCFLHLYPGGPGPPNIYPMEMSSVPRRTYASRSGVVWYDPQSPDSPRHGQKHLYTKKYWNANLGKWCSKKSRKATGASGSRITRLDWPGLPKAFAEDNLGRIRAERVRLFLTLLYRLHLVRHGKGPDGVLYIDNNTLKAFLGYRWSELIEALESEGLIRTRRAPSKYDATKRCLYVKLTGACRPVLPEPAQIPHVEDAVLERTIERHYLRGISTNDPILAALRTTLDQTEFPYPASPVSTPSATMGDKAGRPGTEYRTAAWLGFLSSLPTLGNDTERTFQYGIVRNSFTRRIDHVYTTLPRSWQETLRISGQSCLRVGIRNSLPGMLYLLSNKKHTGLKGKMTPFVPTSFLERFNVANQAKMEVFDYMTLRLEGRNSLKDPGKYEEMRTLFLRMLFGPPEGKFKGRDVSELIRLVFGYDMLEYLRETRRNAKGRPDSFFHKNLSSVLQREEADLMDAVMARLEGIPYIPMHDALIVPGRHVAAARKAFTEELRNRGWDEVLQVS